MNRIDRIGTIVSCGAERALVEANRELIARFEKKVQAALARIWGEDRKDGNEHRYTGCTG